MLTRGAISCFFFQAEDGIRDLVRSRGLGDVYKRQVEEAIVGLTAASDGPKRPGETVTLTATVSSGTRSVSYTHLTLPTNHPV